MLFGSSLHLSGRVHHTEKRNANLFHSFSMWRAIELPNYTIHQNSPKTSGISLFRLSPADMSSDQSPAYAVHRWDCMGLYNTVLYMVFIRSHIRISDLCESATGMLQGFQCFPHV